MREGLFLISSRWCIFFGLVYHKLNHRRRKRILMFRGCRKENARKPKPTPQFCGETGAFSGRPPKNLAEGDNK